MIRELKTFTIVAKTGSFAAAGQQIGLTQSAVSAQIKHLEQLLGVNLFDRTGRSVALNAAGQRAAPMAAEILTIFGAMGKPATLDDLRGDLRIGAISSAQSTLLPRTLIRLRQLAPGIEPKLIPGVSLHLLNQVGTGELDLAIIIKPPFPLPKEISAQPICAEEFVLITPPDVLATMPLVLLREQPFVRYDRSSFGGQLVTRFLSDHRLSPRQVLELDELDAIVQMVESGLGVALLPKAGMWCERSPRVNVVQLQELAFHRELILIHRPAGGKSLVRDLFGKCLFESPA